MKPRIPTLILASIPLLAAAAGADTQLAGILTSPTPANSGVYGNQVFLSAGQLLIPAPGEATVHVYEQIGGAWTEVQQVKLANGGGFSRVDVEGDALVLGATTAGTIASGVVYAFERSGGVWSETQTISPITPIVFEWFGTELAVSGDHLAVNTGPFGTSIYLFERSGGVWTETAQIPKAIGSPYGAQMDMDGSTLLLSGATAPSTAGVDAFEWDGAVWNLQTTLFPSLNTMGFGWQLDLDGDLAVVSATVDPLSSTGSVYAFQRSGTSWSEVVRLVPSNTTVGVRFGSDVHLGASSLIVGASWYPTGTWGGGGAYVIDRASWTETALLTPPTAPGVDGMGEAVFADDLGNFFCGDWRYGTTLEEGAVYHYFGGLYTTVCNGEAGLASCPCGNESPAGSGEGCLNSTGFGGLLEATGTVSVAADDLVLQTSQLPPKRIALAFGGTGNNTWTFGGGRRCAKLQVRYPVQMSGVAGTLGTGFIASRGGFVAGDTRRFQVAYRDPVGSPCGATFNVTNAIQVTFCP